MISNKNKLPLRIWSNILRYYEDKSNRPIQPNYHTLDPSIHYKDGIRPVVRPEFNSEIERLGELYFIPKNEDPGFEGLHDVVSYRIIPIPEEELKQRELNNIRFQRSEAIRLEAERQQEQSIMQPIHALTDIEEILKNEEKIPLWYDFDLGHQFEMPFKIRAYRQGVMTIFDLRIAHAKESFEPETTPALWNAYVIGGDGIEVWEQQSGDTGKYPLIDPTTSEPYRVSHNNETWQNRRVLNISEPGTNSSGWMRVSNLPAPWYHIGNEGYPLNWEIIHNGRLWRNDSANNFWEPGVSGWTDIGAAP